MKEGYGGSGGRRDGWFINDSVFVLSVICTRAKVSVMTLLVCRCHYIGRNGKGYGGVANFSHAASHVSK